MLYYLLITISLLSLALSYNENSTCILSNNNDICENIMLFGQYIHAGIIIIFIMNKFLL